MSFSPPSSASPSRRISASRTAASGDAARRPDRRALAIIGLPSKERLKVNEIFYSLQGESTQVGRPCVLVRLTGCQMRCRWCDSEYSFYEGQWQTLDEIETAVATYGCKLVEITGGEPLLQPGSLSLMARLCDAGYELMLETGGGVDISHVDERVRRIVDVKCPGSGESSNNRLENLDVLTARDEVKFVLADRTDYDFATGIVDLHRLCEVCTVHFAPVDGELDPGELAEWMLSDGRDVRLAGQLHKRLWGEARGV